LGSWKECRGWWKKKRVGESGGQGGRRGGREKVVEWDYQGYQGLQG